MIDILMYLLTFIADSGICQWDYVINGDVIATGWMQCDASDIPWQNRVI